MENKTIEYKGKVYEIGKYYLFADSVGCVTECLKLVYIVANVEGYVFKSKGNCWKTIKELPSSDNFGTITGKPVELVDGAAYIYMHRDKEKVGFYADAHKGFCGEAYGFNLVNLVDYCTNIRKMGVIEE